MHLRGNEKHFKKLLTIIEAYWESRLPSDGDSCVLVEALHQDIRVIMRNLVMANAIRGILGGKLVVVTGTDEEWSEALWQEFDVEHVRALAEAFGASEVINVHDLVDRQLAHGGPHSRIDPLVMRELEDATVCRLNLIPRLPEVEDAKMAARRARTRAFADVYDSLFDRLSPAALITSHVDYDQWGLAVESAMRRETPVVHVQSTGSLKAYALFPENRGGHRTFREELTVQLGELFERDIWPNREVIRSSAEMVTWRAKGNFGRPSWWRAGSSTKFELRTETERRQMREIGAARHGLNPDLPNLVVFNHAVSDALGTNHELFGSLAEWFEETVRFAASNDSANWVFLDHPSQIRYDVTGHFDTLAERYRAYAHLHFMPSVSLSKNMLWSLADLGVTVRGSVSNELPAYGIPAIQAGWSEWSACGLSTVARTRAEYWHLLEESIDLLAKGVPLLGAEQKERARLWMWLYRSGADLSSPLVPHWESGAGDELLRALSVNMGHLESDGDPLYPAIQRMWERREPVLTRFDLRDSAQLANTLTVMRRPS